MTAAGVDSGDFVLLGKVTKPQGIRGEVRVFSYGDAPENFAQYRHLLFTNDEGKGEIVRVCTRSRAQGRLVVLRLEGIVTRDAAEGLVGHKIWVHKEKLPAAADDEFYLYALEGKQVLSEDGRVIGFVEHFLSTGAQDLLVVKDGTKEHLIPLVRDFLVGIENDKVVMKLPPGLLEING